VGNWAISAFVARWGSCASSRASIRATISFSSVSVSLMLRTSASTRASREANLPPPRPRQHRRPISCPSADGPTKDPTEITNRPVLSNGRSHHRRLTMKTFILALVAAVSLGVGSANLANAAIQSANHQFAPSQSAG
jgi:hypothetical protein